LIIQANYYFDIMPGLPSDLDPLILFSLISQGNETAFKILFENNKKKIYATAFKWTKCEIAAEEITQEVFISIWISRSKLSLVKEPVAYIYTVAFNHIRRFLKKEKNRSRILQLSVWNHKKVSNETVESIELKESQELINQALCKLTPQKKLIFNLSRQQGRSYEEIGQSLNLSPHTVKSHLSQAVKFIRAYLDTLAILLTGLSVTFIF